MNVNNFETNSYKYKKGLIKIKFNHEIIIFENGSYFTKLKYLIIHFIDK
jgi:hypothetical protein